ncbi:MAG: hypothetical protein WCT20_05240 [Candidatus Babeliales bacterium]
MAARFFRVSFFVVLFFTVATLSGGSTPLPKVVPVPDDQKNEASVQPAGSVQVEKTGKPAGEQEAHDKFIEDFVKKSDGNVIYDGKTVTFYNAPNPGAVKKFLIWAGLLTVGGTIIYKSSDISNDFPQTIRYLGIIMVFHALRIVPASMLLYDYFVYKNNKVVLVAFGDEGIHCDGRLISWDNIHKITLREVYGRDYEIISFLNEKAIAQLEIGSGSSASNDMLVKLAHYYISKNKAQNKGK